MKLERMGEIFAMNEKDIMAEYYRMYGGIFSEGNFLFVPGKAEGFMLLAHTDTVAKGDFQFEMRVRNLIIDNAFVDILGGDDRAGVLAIEEIFKRCKSKKRPVPSILLTAGEESGSHGMKAFIASLRDLTVTERINIFKHINLFLSLDRKGFGEFVCYNGIPDEHKAYLESYGFDKGFGSYSDVKLLTEYTYIPHANLAIGYHSNHSSNEYMVIDEWAATVNRVMMMLEHPPERKMLTEKTLSSYYQYKWQREDEESYGGYYHGGSYNSGQYNKHQYKKGGKYWKYFQKKEELKKAEEIKALDKTREEILKQAQRDAQKDKAVIVQMPPAGGVKGLSQDAAKGATPVKDILKNSFPRSAARSEEDVCVACGIKTNNIGYFSDVTCEHSAGEYWLCKNCARTYAPQMLPLGTEYVYGFEKTDPDFHEELVNMTTDHIVAEANKKKEEAAQ